MIGTISIVLGSNLYCKVYYEWNILNIWTNSISQIYWCNDVTGTKYSCFKKQAWSMSVSVELYENKLANIYSLVMYYSNAIYKKTFVDSFCVSDGNACVDKTWNKNLQVIKSTVATSALWDRTTCVTAHINLSTLNIADNSTGNRDAIALIYLCWCCVKFVYGLYK